VSTFYGIGVLIRSDSFGPVLSIELLQIYCSPSRSRIPTLEKLATAVDVPLWQIIRGTDGGPTPAPIVESQEYEMSPGVKNDIRRIEYIMVRMSAKNRKLLVGIARRMASS
jgi:hypothetical protein